MLAFPVNRTARRSRWPHGRPLDSQVVSTFARRRREKALSAQFAEGLARFRTLILLEPASTPALAGTKGVVILRGAAGRICILASEGLSDDALSAGIAAAFGELAAGGDRPHAGKGGR